VDKAGHAYLRIFVALQERQHHKRKRNLFTRGSCCNTATTCNLRTMLSFAYTSVDEEEALRMALADVGVSPTTVNGLIVSLLKAGYTLQCDDNN
jgi:hypothetical protein